MGDFNLLNLLNNQSKTDQSSAGTKSKFKIEMIDVRLLEPSDNNFYSVDSIDDLKDSIEMFGIQQNLTVKPIAGTAKYQVLSGHRRRLAALALTEEGKKQFQLVPCRVEHDEDDLKEQILLIHTNSTARELSDYEKVEQLAKLKPLLQEYKKTHELPGRVRELLAASLNVSKSQVGRMERINDNLIPELKDEMKDGKLGFTAAAEIARKPAEQQQAAREKLKKPEIKPKPVSKPKEEDGDKESKALIKAISKFLQSESGRMTLANDIEKLLPKIEQKINDIQYGNIEFTIQKGKIVRFDYRGSIKPETGNKD